MKADLKTLILAVDRARSLNLNVHGVVVGEDAARALLASAGLHLHSNTEPVLDEQIYGAKVIKSSVSNAFYLAIDFPERP